MLNRHPIRTFSRCVVAAAIGLMAGPLLAAETAHPAGHAPHWGYTGAGGPAHWAQLEEDFGVCKLGLEQSPIDIQSARVKTAADLAPLDFAYSAGAGEVVNNGHTIQVDLAAGGAMTSSGTAFKLLQFHFHTPSEEKINGGNFPLVAHYVHRDAAGHLAVVAVLFKLGRKNAPLAAVFDAMPAEEGGKATLAAFDPATVLPADRRYYAFKGSLTTPPCSEGVAWHVLRTPVDHDWRQLEAFRKIFPRNARPVQPLHGREIRLSAP